MSNFNGKTIFVGAVVLAVVVAVVAGLVTAGSPEAERMRRADQQRLSDLRQISYMIDIYWNHDHVLPASLEDLAKSPNISLQSIRDPRTGYTYEFYPGEGTSYQLCAAFEAPSDSGPDQPPMPATETFWSHGVGRTCFPLEVQKQPSAEDLMMAPKPSPIIQR